MKRIDRLLWAMVAIVFGLSLLSLLIPQPSSSVVDVLAFHFDLALILFGAGLFVPAVVLFVRGLRGFKPTFKVAYLLLCAGVLCIGLGVVILPLITIFDPTESWRNNPIVVVLPFIVSGALIYAGMLLYARLLQVASIWSKPWFVLAFILGGLAITIFLPHADVPDETALDVLNAMVMWVGLFIFAAAMLIMAIKRQTSSIYTNSLAWLFFALISSVLTPVLTVLFGLFAYDAWLSDALVDFCVFISGVLYMRSGYAFVQITAPDIN
ncbi:MAG TPA: hypothetical protein VLA88_03720 [Candidatus Saccharimonadales bacterium]|nr:hypothetical protein [Candidatus Saccharimonadales bacterium]